MEKDGRVRMVKEGKEATKGTETSNGTQVEEGGIGAETMISGPAFGENEVSPWNKVSLIPLPFTSCPECRTSPFR